MRFIIVFIVCLISVIGLSQPVKKVIIIGIDGCRQDALKIAHTPHIDSLISSGFYSPDGLNIDVTKSGPGWSAALTGVWSDKHLVNSNDFSNNNYADYPSIFKHIEAFDSALSTASIVAWYKINDYLVQNDADYTAIIGADPSLGAHVSDIVGSYDPDVLFIQFDDTDLIGHTSGFSPLNPDYIQKIAQTDSHIGRIMDSLEARNTYVDEDWLIIVTTDHGGIGTMHGGNSLEERRSFMVVSGKNVPTQTLLRDSMLVGSAMVYDYSNTPRTVDVAYTVMEHLCIPIDSSWEFAGKSLINHCAAQCQTPLNAHTFISNPTTASLSWDPVFGSTGYILTGGVAGSGNNVSISLVDTSIEFNSLSPQTSYAWQVAAVCDSLVSLYSNAQVFTTPAVCNPPASIFTTNIDSTSVTLNWNTQSNATGYLVSGRGVGNLNITMLYIPNPAAGSLDVTGIRPGINYEWSVRTLCGSSDTSQYAAIDYFTTLSGSSKYDPTIQTINRAGDRDIAIHPNPGSDVVRIQLTGWTSIEKVSIEVWNTTGELVYHELPIKPGNQILINTENWSRGVYMVRCRDAKHGMIRQLVLMD